MTMITGVPLEFRPRADGAPIFTLTAGNKLNVVQSGAGTVSGYFRTFQG